MSRPSHSNRPRARSARHTWRITRDDSGATLTEFLMLAGLIGLVALVAVRRFGTALLSTGNAQGKTVLCIPGENGVAASSDCGGTGTGTPSPGTCTGSLCVGGTNCFVAGTLVATPAGSTPIELVHEGDLVLSRDERSDASHPARVARTFVTPGAPLVELRLRESAEPIRATPGHRFYTRDRGWMAAEELKEDEELVDVADAPLHVARVTPLPQHETVYNFEVEETHTYFVGSAAVWVHNPTAGGSCNGAGGGGGPPWTVENLPAACQDFGDVPPGSSVFWTGGQMTQAQQWAADHPGHTVLENTACYDAIKQDVSAQMATDWAGGAKPIFNESSQNYAAHASGVVNIIVPAGYDPHAPPPNGDNVWSQVEYPTLNTNPRVTQICYQIQAGPGDPPSSPESTVCVPN